MEDIDQNKYTKDDINSLFKDELKNHYLKRDFSGNIDIQDFKNYPVYKNEDVGEEHISKITKFKYKFMIKLVLSLVLGVGIFSYKYLPENEFKNSSFFNWIKSEYKKDYTKEQVMDNLEELSKSVYAKIKNIIPEDMYNNIVDKYVNKIKPEIMSFSLNNLFEDNDIENTVAVFNEGNIEVKSEDIAPIQDTVVTSSQISLMDMDKGEILSKNINMILPVNGTVTSIYGARDEVFENVGYHTGIDVANVLNTEIKSATDGTVVSAQQMDKYYGNNIEIENNGVIFKYAHLNQINVNEGDVIKQGDIIGLMGSTGMSTGSHLHFEIKINGRSVDPELFLKFR